ncbi:MAG: hypothetical protein C3F12_12065 [Candidatus Methylomirabilota bacterium]|nr:MAG: hypothetical protein C3F12_12065 [candidate division NC10 bacterium]
MVSMMDGLSRVNESVPDVGALQRVSESRGDGKDTPRGTPRRRPKRGGSGAATASGDRPLPPGPAEGQSVDQECSEACYSREQTITSIPPKGRLIDIAI